MKILEKIFGKLSIKQNEANFPFVNYQRKRNCIFIHVPKVAGTSILHMLGHKSEGRLHLPWYVYWMANPAYFNEAFKFAFVRNPWDRANSAYNYLVSGGNGKGDAEVCEQIRSFKSYDSFVVNGLGSGRFRNHLLFVPQSEFVLGLTGEVIVDFLGKYENIEHDFKEVADKLNLSLFLPRKNVTKTVKTNYDSVYQKPESIEVISNIYRQDIETFGYTFS